jgi:hypothetical protein
MILSLGRKYIFVHAPKTGGTSMALALEGRAMKDDIMLGDTPKAVKRRKRLKDVKAAGRLWKHSTLADIDGLITPEQMEDLFIFTLVRNPWDRMVSYYHWLQVQTFQHDAVTMAQTMTFTDFAQSAQITNSFNAAPAQHYMTDATGKVRCNAYIRIEHFTKDVVPLVNHLGFDLTLDHVNASNRRSAYQSYYCAASRAAVGQACADDIDRFGYSFE